MNWILWKVTAENFEEVARFADEDLALACGELKGNGYEVTAIGETPIW